MKSNEIKEANVETITDINETVSIIPDVIIEEGVANEVNQDTNIDKNYDIDEMFPPVSIYKVYARVDVDNVVQKIFSTCFEEAKENDVFIKEGNGDEFVHVGYYQVYDTNLCHNYKVIENDEKELVLVETTPEEKKKEIESRPLPPKSEIAVLKEQMVSLIEETL